MSKAIISVTDIEGPLKEIDGLVELVTQLYSNKEIELVDIKVNIMGTHELVNGFLEYVKDKDFSYAGFGTVEFNFAECEESHEIKTNNYEDELENILTQYLGHTNW